MSDCKHLVSNTSITMLILIQQTFPLMCIFLLAGGLSLLNTTGSRAAQIGPVVLFVYLFTICYSLGEGPVAFQYSAEVFPTIQREQGMAWAVCINNTFAGILSLTYPRMSAVMTPTGACEFNETRTYRS